MIFDTGSNWVWIDSRFCVNCPDLPRFDESASTTFNVEPRMRALHYGKGSVNSFKATDTICITEDECADDFTFMVVWGQKDLANLKSSGLIGMSPNHFDSESDLFIEKMKTSGAIDHAMFSLSIGMKDV